MKQADRIKEKKKQKGYKWSLLPLQFILAVLPLILYVYTGNSGYSDYPWSSANDWYIDIFLHGKMVVFLVVAAIVLVLAIEKTAKMDRWNRKQVLQKFIPIFVYFGFVLLSTVCSESISHSLYGAMDAKEPVWVLAGYVIVVFYAYIAIDNMEDVRQLMAAAVAGGTCMALIGVLQAIGKDPFTYAFVQRLFAGKEFLDTYGLLKLTFPVGMAYGTLFNPNYVGTYVAMYLPLLVFGAVLYKQAWKKLICGFSIIGLLVMLFASQSRTGLIAVAAVAFVLVVFLGRKLLKKWYLIVPGVIVVLAAFILVDSQREFIFTNRLKEMFVLQPSEDPVHGVDTTGKGVRVLYKDTEFTVMMPVNGNDFAYVALEGEEQKTVSYNEDKTYGYFTLDNGDEITIQTATYEGSPAFGLMINGQYFYFTNQLVVGNYKYISEIGRLDECIIPKNVFPGYEAVGSGRGYVWGRSIPLLLKNIIVGSGPDNFAIEFPQNDYVARSRSGFETIFFTRPHNVYLQMGIQTGVLSLIAFLVFYMIYFVQSCKRFCFGKYRTTEEKAGFALFLCTVGFMAAGLANDSLIVVTPVYYLLLGLGMAVNSKLCPKEENTSKEKKKGLK